MTCEVACLNKTGLAIAVDSAVSVLNRNRTYHSAEKLFPLPNGEAAIAIYGNAEFIGVPWCLVLREFFGQLGKQRLATLEEYGYRLTDFLESDHPMFTREREETAFRSGVSGYWSSCLAPAFELWGNATTDWSEHHEAWDAVRETLDADQRHWVYPAHPAFDTAFGRRVLTECHDALVGARDQLFESPPPSDVWQGLLSLVERMTLLDWISPNAVSGVVLLGFGADEMFPGYLDLRIAPRLLRRVKVQSAGACVSQDADAQVATFGQSDTVESFLYGTPHRSIRRVEALIAELTSHRPQEGTPEPQRVPGASLATQTSSRLMDWLYEEYFGPLLEAVGALPPNELATLSGTLVSLAAFRSGIATNDTGSIGGEVKVATITKHGGFSWVKRRGFRTA